MSSLVQAKCVNSSTCPRAGAPELGFRGGQLGVLGSGLILQYLRSKPDFLTYEFIHLRPHLGQLGVLGEGLLQDILHRLHIVVGGALHRFHLRRQQQMLHDANLCVESQQVLALHTSPLPLLLFCLPSA
jgi:hypothetical protein